MGSKILLGAVFMSLFVGVQSLQAQSPDVSPEPEASADPDPMPDVPPEPAPSAEADPMPEVSPAPATGPGPIPDQSPEPESTETIPEDRTMCCVCQTWAGADEFGGKCKKDWDPLPDCEKKAAFDWLNPTTVRTGKIAPAALSWMGRNKCDDVRIIMHTHGSPAACPLYFQNVRACWSVMKRNDCQGKVEMISTACSVFGNIELVKAETKKIANECEEGYSCYVVAHMTDGLLGAGKFCGTDPDGNSSVAFATSWVDFKEGGECKAGIAFPLCSDIVGDGCASYGEIAYCKNYQNKIVPAKCIGTKGWIQFYTDVLCKNMLGRKCERAGMRTQCILPGGSKKQIFCPAEGSRLGDTWH